MKVQHIMMGSVLLVFLLTACQRVHLKGDEIVHSGEANQSDMISAGGQQGLSNMEDYNSRTKRANGQGLRHPDEPRK
ncbi:MAG: hypothetical protein CV081_08100 [Nitrospira sp. LK265]|nr:hypothetical protein [Nitrospira sp.]NGZ60449.1 hypothetical protein [Nitrospira sp. LK265]